MFCFLAVLPILTAVIMMTVFRISPGKSLAAAWCFTVLNGMIFWKVNCAVIGAATLNGIFKALDIVLIIFGAVLLLNVQKATGMLRSISNSFHHISDDRRIQVLIIGWLFSGLMEGAAGFGAAPAVVAPLLVSLGFPAFTAVAVALICNTLPVAFGGVGTPFFTALNTTSQNLLDMGLEPEKFNIVMMKTFTIVSGLSGALIPFCAIVIMILLSKEKRKLRSMLEILPLTLLTAAVYILPWQFTANHLGPELPSIMGAAVGLPLLLFCVKFRFLVPKYVWRFPDEPEINSVADTPGEVPVWKAWMPYILLTVLLLLTRVQLLPLRKFFRSYGILNLPDFFDVSGTGLRWMLLNNPGLFPFLLLALGTALWMRLSWKEQGKIVIDTAKQLQMAALAIIVSTAMVQIMVFSNENAANIPGMLSIMAQTAADGMGKAFIAVSPFLGVLGTFFAGSCTVSNILFASLQLNTAHLLEYPPETFFALQVTGGGLGSMIRISGIIAACAAVGLQKKEGKLLLLNLIPTIIFALLALLVVWILYL